MPTPVRHPTPPFRRRRPGSRRLPVAVLACLVPLAGGCGRDADVRPGDIRSFVVPPGLEPEPIAATPRQPAAAAAGSERLRYEVPEGWSDRGASGMRLATLAIGDPADGREVTVIPASGTLRGNVERWHGQLAAGADEAARATAVDKALAEAESFDVDGSTATLVMVGGPAAGEDDAGEVILGAMIPRDDAAALFVKFKGAADVARRERGNFVRFVRSVRWK